MNKDEAKDLIVEHIARVQGCKGTELAAAWAASSLLNMDYREKSFYLPGNTRVEVHG
jgi:hypothetical protein